MPYTICHAAMSLDGRSLLSRWRPEAAVAEGLFDRVYEEVGGDAWIVGRVMGRKCVGRDVDPRYHPTGFGDSVRKHHQSNPPD